MQWKMEYIIAKGKVYRFVYITYMNIGSWCNMYVWQCFLVLTIWKQLLSKTWVHTHPKQDICKATPTWLHKAKRSDTSREKTKSKMWAEQMSRPLPRSPGGGEDLGSTPVTEIYNCVTSFGAQRAVTLPRVSKVELDCESNQFFFKAV